ESGAERERQVHGEVAIRADVIRHRRGIERLRCPFLVQKEVSEPQRELRFLERHTRVTGGADDAAPVRVAAEYRRLDEGALGNRLGYFVRLRIGTRTLDVNGHKVTCALRIAGHVAREFDTHFHGGRIEFLKRSALQLWALAIG